MPASLACTGFGGLRQWSRRSLMRAGTAGMLGLALPALLRAEARGNPAPHAPGAGLTSAPKAKHVLFLHQFGGPSHIDTFDLKPDAPDAVRSLFRPIATNVPGMHVCEHLPRMAQVMGEFAQVRSVHHRIMNHNPAAYYSLTGHAPLVDDIRLRDTQELFPAYGSVVSRYRPVTDPALPSFVSLPHRLRDGSVTPGQSASFFGKAYDPFFIGQDPNRSDFRLPELALPESMPLERLDNRRGLLAWMDHTENDLTAWNELAQGMEKFYDRALRMLASPKVQRAFDLSQESPALRDAYGRSTYGQSCLLARRLLEAGVRFVSVYFSNSIGGEGKGGWDTHGRNFEQLENRLLPLTNQTVPTLIQDLKARGLLDETLVVWMGEFGRTPKITHQHKYGPDGREHWPHCYTVLLAGGGITGGAVHGASDKMGAYPTRDAVKPDDIAATLFWALGIDPSTEVFDPLGRPLPLAVGKPLTHLFA